MRDNPLVSIITPCFNGEEFLERYFNSILTQTWSNLELIFINDGSTDHTEEIVNSYRGKLKTRGIEFTYIYQKNAGQAAALNQGLKLFHGEYLTWPDSDDEMMPKCIERKVEFLEKNPCYGFCMCQGIAVSEEEPDKCIEIRQRYHLDEDENYLEDMMWVQNMPFEPVAYMVRTSVLDVAISDREIYSGRGGQNAQILLPVACRSRLGYLDEILYRYYVRKESHSHSLNDSIAKVKQWENYETIVNETMKKTENNYWKIYHQPIMEFYARNQFGNAVDSKDPALISKYYAKLKMNGKPTIKERMLYMKYGHKRLFKSS